MAKTADELLVEWRNAQYMVDMLTSVARNNSQDSERYAAVAKALHELPPNAPDRDVAFTMYTTFARIAFSQHERASKQLDEAINKANALHDERVAATKAESP